MKRQDKNLNSQSSSADQPISDEIIEEDLAAEEI